MSVPEQLWSELLSRSLAMIPNSLQKPLMGNSCSNCSDDTSILPSDPTKVIFKKGAHVHWTGRGEMSTAPTSDIQTAPETSNVTMNRDSTSEIHSSIGALTENAKLITVTVRSERMREEVCPEEGRGNFNIRCSYMIKLENGEVKKVEEGQLISRIAKDR
ncbi:hypothetical protein BHYA_0144g00090 [Botrytis hyacinthi]|uniref:Uncharacterized protein n=1 Tax=Botrytis hyacinthi TaxID=278943 RepID=A0A4Z1GK80_9HELO|nr:hypothetical protein BHYA_0144g00090 [Botrytis hyacinthi]